MYELRISNTTLRHLGWDESTALRGCPEGVSRAVLGRRSHNVGRGSTHLLTCGTLDTVVWIRDRIQRDAALRGVHEGSTNTGRTLRRDLATCNAIIRRAW